MYPHAYEVELQSPCGERQSTVSGTVERRWAPGYIPHILRVVSVLSISGVTTGRLSIRKGVFGATTASGDEVGAINLTSGMSAGAAKYSAFLNVRLVPGDELTVVASTAASTVNTTVVKAFVEPNHDIPGNNSRMSLTS